LARGSGIIAELLRLSNNIPKIFLNCEDDNLVYKDILMDLEYLKNTESNEERILKTPNYQQLEENLFNRYASLVKRFVDLFESIVSYSGQLNRLMKDIYEGTGNYVETFEILLENDISKQVMLESFYFLGVMLIFLENLIPGPVREKIIICHVRVIGGQNTMPNLHEITKLCKKTEFLPDWFPNEEKRTALLNLPSASLDKKMFTEYNFTEKIFARMSVESRPSSRRKVRHQAGAGGQGRRHIQRNARLPQPRPPELRALQPGLHALRGHVLHPRVPRQRVFPAPRNRRQALLRQLDRPRIHGLRSRPHQRVAGLRRRQSRHRQHRLRPRRRAVRRKAQRHGQEGLQ
jgi:hypothetical protein